MKGRKEVKARNSIVLFCMCLLIFSLGCEKEKSQESSGEETADEETFKVSEAVIEPLPLLEEDFLFESSHGWLNDDTIIFSANKDNEYFLYSYNVSTEKKEVIYQTNKIIAEASISPNGHFILLYTFEDDDQAFIHILTAEGEEQYTMSVPSREIAYSWNPRTETKLVLNLFLEDWTYRTFILDFEKEAMEEIELSQPFAKWYTEDEFIYIQLDEEGPETAGTLITESVQGHSISAMLENVITFNSGENVLVAAQIVDEHLLEYVFMIDGNEKNRYAVEWSMADMMGMNPEYALNEERHFFYTFILDGQVNQLVMYNYETDEQQLIMEDLEMAPIAVSPNGKRILYGYSLENLIEVSVE